MAACKGAIVFTAFILNRALLTDLEPTTKIDIEASEACDVVVDWTSNNPVRDSPESSCQSRSMIATDGVKLPLCFCRTRREFSVAVELW